MLMTNDTVISTYLDLPIHPLLSVSSLYPEAQLQVNPGSSFVQVWAHPPLLSKHWFSSVYGRKEKK